METLRHVKHLLRPSNKTFIRLSGLLGRFKHPVWVIGAGRSGTTWLCNLISAQSNYRFLFEPFHSAHNPEADFLPNHYYLRPGETDPRLMQLADNVFGGSTYFPDLDRANKHKLFDGLLIKDISANLFSYAINRVKPKIKPILIIRHPFAVALSRQRKPEWNWFNEPEEFLNQKTLMQDYPEIRENLIREISNTGDFFLNQILIWSVIHTVPLKQFGNSELHVLFYESLVQNTEKELRRIAAYLGKKSPAAGNVLNENIKYQPSRTTGLSEDELRKKSAVEWQNYVSDEHRFRGNEILKQFGLDFLYDDNGYPAISPLDVLN